MDNSLPTKYLPFSPSNDKTSSTDDARGFMEHIELTFKSMNDEIFKLNKNQIALQNLLDKSIQNLDLRINDLESEIGNKPPQLDEKFDAPNLWGVVATSANHINLMDKSDTDYISEDAVQQLIQGNGYSIKRSILSRVEPLESTTSSLKNTLIGVARRLKQQADVNTKDIQGIMTSSSFSSSGPSLPKDFAADISSDVDILKTKLEEHDIKLAKLNVTGEAIKFNSLGFISKIEADAWLELHAPNGNFGLIVDFHTLMEHIHHSITGVDALKQLQNVFKLKLHTISEALSVTSFEVPVPRFLTSTGAHVVIDNQASYFSHIKTFKEWNDPNSGFKLRLKKELERFRRSHLSTIRERISVRSPLYQLATSTLMESIGWANGLINYVDITYEEYAAGKFGRSKAWHVTTKLATALIREVGKPREGALNSFEAGNAVSMSKVVFYAVLQSLDVMAAISEADYRDSPVVSTELVKFLSLNTAVDAVDTLELKSTEFDTSIKQLNKDMSGANKAVSSVGNKADELKKAVDIIRKRVEKLESKK